MSDAATPDAPTPDAPTADAPAPNAVGWFEIYVHDMDRATKFYEHTLGVPLETLDASGIPGPPLVMKTFPMSEHGAGASGALVKMEDDGPPPGRPGGTLVYFSCADCAAEAGRAEAAGGAVVQGKTAIGPFGFIAVLKDSEGNTIGLHSRA